MGQEQKKYHIADDGRIFQINDDGSFTAIGNVNQMPQSNPQPQPQYNAYTSPTYTQPTVEEDIADENEGFTATHMAWLLIGLILFFGSMMVAFASGMFYYYFAILGFALTIKGLLGANKWVMIVMIIGMVLIGGAFLANF